MWLVERKVECVNDGTMDVVLYTTEVQSICVILKCTSHMHDILMPSWWVVQDARNCRFLAVLTRGASASQMVARAASSPCRVEVQTDSKNGRVQNFVASAYRGHPQSHSDEPNKETHW